jgi:hypothetical protein
VSGLGGLSGGEALLEGAVGQGWWLVVDEEDGSVRTVGGPFPDRGEASWAAGLHPEGGSARPVFGTRRADGGLSRRPSPQDWAWLAELTDQLERLPEGWDATLAEDDPLVTLLVEVAAALLEAGLPLHDASGDRSAFGGACLSPEVVLGGIVVSWRQHDRMSIDRVHGPEMDAEIQPVMNRALADVLLVRGFEVYSIPGSTGHVVRRAS